MTSGWIADQGLVLSRNAALFIACFSRSFSTRPPCYPSESYCGRLYAADNGVSVIKGINPVGLEHVTHLTHYINSFVSTAGLDISSISLSAWLDTNGWAESCAAPTLVGQELSLQFWKAQKEQQAKGEDQWC